MDSNQQQISDIAQSYFDGVHADLLEFGGTLTTRLSTLHACNHDSITAIFDTLAVLLASKYHQGELDYEIADWLANEFESDLANLILDV
ncbi:MAG: hypothetical protein ABJP34_10880 [Erythrobacter sp.]